MTPSEIRSLLIESVARYTDTDAQEIDPGYPFIDYGLDSVAAVLLSADLEDRLGIEIRPTVAWDFPTIEKLAAHLAEQVPAAG